MVSRTHLVEKTIDSINGLTVDHPTDPYHIMEKMQMALMVSHRPILHCKIAGINVFPQKTLTWGQLFSSLITFMEFNFILLKSSSA